MGKPKAKRYFEQDVDDESKTKKEHKVITYNVHPKPKPWGRRAADKINKNKKKLIIKKVPNPNPKFKGKPKISQKLLTKHSRGEGVSKEGIRTSIHKQKFEKREKILQYATDVAARTEVLLTEDAGYLEADDGETTTQFTQKQIVDNVDITAATKHFDLQLNDFGPYRAKYTRNGRHLVLGGQKGHVAAFDWVTKKLHCELNVMESVHDVSWLHIETMFAVAQKDWVYMYDNQGIELHCVKRLNKITRMEFLPYHFLLAACSEQGYLSWLDISIGQLVTQYNSKLGQLKMMTQNPWNAVLCVGHSKGVVSMWSPNSRDPLAKMLCHKAPLTALHVDPKGTYMATASSNRELKIWDIRKLEGPLQEYKLISAANNLAFSQKNLLAVGMGNVVEVYRDCCVKAAKRPYLRHRFVTAINNFNFCPYEDVLGVATTRGFTSLIVPGSGEPNFDALEANPFQTKSQRREAEVKSLLEKIQPELITLDPTAIAEIDVPTLRDKIDSKQKLLVSGMVQGRGLVALFAHCAGHALWIHLKPPQINYEQRNKAKGRGGSVKMSKNKKIVREQAKKEWVKNTKDLVPKFEVKKKRPNSSDFNALNRFLPKK